MKNYFTIFALFLSTTLLAQIPNGNMESWTKGSMGAVTWEDPTGWFTENSTLALVGITSVFKDSLDVHSGKYAADLFNVSIFGITNAPGVMLLGSIDNTTMEPVGGIPFTQRPSSFDGFYRYLPAANDTCLMGVILTKWNTTTNNRDSVGIAFFSSSANTATYTAFSAPFVYFLSDNPDTMQVFISSSTNFTAAPAGTELKIDDLSLPGATGIPSLQDIYNVSYYPNPVKDQLNVVLNDYERASKVEVYNILGNNLTSVYVKGKIVPLNLSSYAPGTYFFRVIGKDGSILKTDKFNKVN